MASFLSLNRFQEVCCRAQRDVSTWNICAVKVSISRPNTPLGAVNFEANELGMRARDFHTALLRISMLQPARDCGCRMSCSVHRERHSEI
jgi:hypothetical protein